MIGGEPEVRGNVPSASFNPHARWTDGATTVPSALPVELQQQRADRRDRLPRGIPSRNVLRRYVTYCARRRRYAAMQGAADLLAERRE